MRYKAFEAQYKQFLDIDPLPAEVDQSGAIYSSRGARKSNQFHFRPLFKILSSQEPRH